MFQLPFARVKEPVLRGTRVTLRSPRHNDWREWAALRRESREFLEPWEPRWAPDELDWASWRQRIARYREDARHGTSLAFLIFSTRENNLLGGITLGNIRHGVSQSAHIGYWMGERHAGRGYMVDAVTLLSAHAFGAMRLHRLEAACIPSNNRSVRVLEKAGFQREGVARSFLRINGAWQDHLLFALIAGDPATQPRKG